MLGQPMRTPSIKIALAAALPVRSGFDCVFFFTAAKDYQNGNIPFVTAFFTAFSSPSPLFRHRFFELYR
jgi:hypothetical protein